MSKSILLVEDENNIALALEFVFRRRGYRVRVASTGPDALIAMRAEVPDLVLLDVGLPGCSGLDVCEIMRADETFDDVRILLMTAKTTEAVRRTGLDLGADDFVIKPFGMSDLQHRVETLLDDRAA